MNAGLYLHLNNILIIKKKHKKIYFFVLLIVILNLVQSKEIKETLETLTQQEDNNYTINNINPNFLNPEESNLSNQSNKNNYNNIYPNLEVTNQFENSYLKSMAGNNSNDYYIGGEGIQIVDKLLSKTIKKINLNLKKRKQKIRIENSSSSSVSKKLTKIKKNNINKMDILKLTGSEKNVDFL